MKNTSNLPTIDYSENDEIAESKKWEVAKACLGLACILVMLIIVALYLHIVVKNMGEVHIWAETTNATTGPAI